MSVLVTGNAIPRTRAELSRRVLATTDSPAFPALYRCLAGRLFIPADAELSAPVSDAELRDLLPGASSFVLVWHPVIGLTGYEPEQILAASQLLRGPDESPAGWDAAKAGPILNDRIRSLSPEPENQTLGFLDQAGGDIGSDAGNLDDAPRSPDEKSLPKVRDALNSLRERVAKSVHAVTNKLSSIPGGSKLLGGAHQWASSVLASTAAAAGSASGLGGRSSDGARSGSGQQRSGLSTHRENAIKRLLHLLESNPDFGLRFAIPFGGGSSRGAAPPSGGLFERSSLDFDPSRLRESGPADQWNISWDYQFRLTQCYRELAQRELRLGNHRRAAYIYAKLLDDLASAAAALEAGNFHRDAAIIWLKYLRNPLRAANCFRDGGLWEEALPIYREHERWLDAAELHLRLGQEAEARQLFELELAVREKRFDFPGAADIAEHKLRDDDRAARLLSSGWTVDSCAAECWARLFELYGRRGHHDRAAESLRTLIDQLELSVPRMPVAVKSVTNIATTYPDQHVRQQARLRSWQLSSILLSLPNTEGRSAALRSVQELAPTDNLVSIDTQRYREFVASTARARQSVNTTSQSTRRERRTPAMERHGFVQLRLSQNSQPDNIAWHNGVTNCREIFLSGKHSRTQPVIARFGSPQNFDGQPWIGSAAFLVRAARDSDDDEMIDEESGPHTVCDLRLSPGGQRVWIHPLPGRGVWSEHCGDLRFTSDVFAQTLPPLNTLTSAHALLDFAVTDSGTLVLLLLSESGTPVIAAGLPQHIELESSEIRFPDDHINTAATANCRLWLTEDGKQRTNHRLILQTGSRIWKLNPGLTRRFDVSGGSAIDASLMLELTDEPVHRAIAPRETEFRIAFSQSLGAVAVWPDLDIQCAFARNLSHPRLGCTNHGVFVAMCSETHRIEAWRLSGGNADLVAALDAPPLALLAPVIAILPAANPGRFLILRQDGMLECFAVSAG